MPALYALAQHGALEAASSQLLAGESLLAYLDDVYVLCAPERATEVFRIVTAALQEHAGVQANRGKCCGWNRGGLEPPGLALLGADVWIGGASTRAEEQGIKVLGTPIGSPAFVAAQTDRRMGEERRFLDMLPDLPDFQCAWSLLLHCAVPRSTLWSERCRHHSQPLMRTVTTRLCRGSCRTCWELPKAKRCVIDWPPSAQCRWVRAVGEFVPRLEQLRVLIGRLGPTLCQCSDRGTL